MKPHTRNITPAARPPAFRVLAAAMVAALLLPACTNFEKSDGDFNAVIPRIMNELTGPKPEEAAANLFDTTSPDQRRDAIAVLSKKKWGHEPPYIKAYTLLATDPHPMVRAQALKALGGARSPSVVHTLLGDGKPLGLEDKDPVVRQDAAAALIESFAPQAIDPLIRRLAEDEDPQVRMNAARALANTSEPRAIRALIDGLDDRNAGVTFYSHQSLQRITGQKITSDARQWLAWYQQQRWPAATKPAEG